MWSVVDHVVDHVLHPLDRLYMLFRAWSRSRHSPSISTQHLVPSRNYGYIRNLETFFCVKPLIRLKFFTNVKLVSVLVEIRKNL